MKEKFDQDDNHKMIITPQLQIPTRFFSIKK